MRALQNAIVLEKKTDKVFELNHLTIYIIKNGEMIDFLITNPSNNNIPVNGEYYYFDFSLIRELSKKHPLKFSKENKTFLTKRDFEFYREDAKAKPKFLFCFPAQYRYEGTFEVVVPKSDSVQNPMQAIDTLQKEFFKQKLGPIKIVYVLTAENRKHSDRLVMEVQTSRNVYDLYKSGFRKREWKPTKIVMTSIWKK